jgi:ferric-dicitrate binding protein FerR (iron transport regulator)
MSVDDVPRAGSYDLRIDIARLEAKLDVALAQHGATLDEHTRAITELQASVRRIQDRPIATPDAIIDHEHRLRAVEARPTVTPKAVWTAVGVLAAVVATATQLIGTLVGG